MVSHVPHGYADITHAYMEFNETKSTTVTSASTTTGTTTTTITNRFIFRTPFETFRTQTKNII